MIFLKVFLLLTISTLNGILAQNSTSGTTAATTPIVIPRVTLTDTYKRISEGAQRFGFELLREISNSVHATKENRNFMISPFAVWSLLLLLTEGAAGNTLKELTNTLHIEEDQQALRQVYREIQTFLKINTTTIEVASLQALFSDSNQPVQRDFESIIERDYGSVLVPVDFHDPGATYERINDEIHKATRGLITRLLLPQDIKDANLILLSMLYFKGQWKHPFNQTLTRTEIFYDEHDNPIGNVQMMTQEAHFKYAGVNELEAHVLELPYGKEDRLSMLVILPRKGVSLNKVVNNLVKIGIAPLFQHLSASSGIFEDENVEVYLPKFTTFSDLALTSVLEQLGIKDIFDPAKSNLSRMASDLFVAQILHTTKIIVNEEGTIAAAVASAVLSNKATPPKFYLNRPFLYLIIEKSTNLLLFAGQLANPKNI